jgi:hypothetical protein
MLISAIKNDIRMLRIGSGRYWCKNNMAAKIKLRKERKGKRKEG